MKVIMILTNGFAPDLRVYKEAKYLAQKCNEVEILCWDRENKYIDKPVDNLEKFSTNPVKMPVLFSTFYLKKR